MRSGRNSKFGFRLLATSVAAAAVLSACGGGNDNNNGGGPIVCPTCLTADLNAVVGTLNTGQLAGLGSLPNVAGGVLAGLSASHDGGGVMRQMIAGPARVVVRDHGGFFSRPLRRERVGLGPQAGGIKVAQGDVVDDAQYTHSYSYDAVETFQYVDDGRNAGPADGVLFVLYQVDANGDIVVPLVETGTLVIHDLSTATTDKVGIEINGTGSESFANYTVEIANFDPQASSYQIISGGTVSSDGTTQYDFTYNETSTSITDFTDAITFGRAGVTLSNNIAVATDETSGTETDTYDVTLADGTESVRLSGPLVFQGSSLASFDFKVFTNGDLYAEATTLDANDDPIFLKSDGNPISAAELNFLETLVGTALEVSVQIFILVYIALLLL